MIVIKPFRQQDKKTLYSLIKELQDYLIRIDPQKRLRRLPGYEKKSVEALLKKIETNSGKIFIATDNGAPLGFIAGIIQQQKKDDLLECVPTKGGRILELIVSEGKRGKNIGSLLMNKMEEYFKQKKCTVIRVEVFTPNILAHNFYKKFSYNDRVVDMIKTLGK